MFGFTGLSVLVKALGAVGIGSFQTMLWRSVIGVIIIVPLLWRAGGLSVLRTRRPGLHLTRAISGTFAVVCAYYALTKLPLADVTAISFTISLFTTVLAVLVLKEHVGWRRWSATVAGFVGVLVIVRPGGDGFEPAALVALGMGIGVAISITVVKSVPTEDSDLALLCWFFGGSILVSALPAAFAWKTPDVAQWCMLLGVGVLGLVSQASIIRAYRLSEASFLAPFDYLRLLIAGVAGYLIFAETPDVWSIGGSAIIIGSTLYIAQREAQLRRTRRSRTLSP